MNMVSLRGLVTKNEAFKIYMPPTTIKSYTSYNLGPESAFRLPCHELGLHESLRYHSPAPPRHSP
jgi:hypothetical protein